MAVGYIKKKQKLSVNGTIREVYLAKVCHGTEVRTDALADEISKTCSASPADVLMHVRALEDCISRRIAMGDVVKLAEEKGIRDKVKIMIGGAPITEAFCQQIGADAYTPDATTAAEVALQFCAQ